MAGLSTPLPRPQPSKQMSSRLLNMKFMQRAGASTPNSSTSTPRTQHSYTNTPTSEPTNKRRRLDNNTHSPHISEPTSPTRSPFEGLGRVGSNTFDRGPGAETEWVLNLGIKFPQPTKGGTSNSQNDSMSSSIPGLGQTPVSEAEDEETDEDLWHDQPAGRQTFGTFKQKRKSRVSTSSLKASDDHDQDDESASGSDSESASANEDSDSEASVSDSQDDSRRSGNATARSSRKGHKLGNGVDSDEEMQRVRREMKKKHDRLAGVGTPQSNRSSHRNQRGSGGGGGGGDIRSEHQQRQKYNKSQSTPDSTGKRKWGGNSSGPGDSNDQRVGGSAKKNKTKAGKGRMSL